MTLIELPLGERRTVNVVLVEGERLTLVDTGMGDATSMAALEQGLARQGYTVENIRQIVLTHAHPDHFGGAAEIARRSGALIITDVGSVPVLAGFPSSFPRQLAPRIDLCREAGAPEAIVVQLATRQARFAETGSPITPSQLVAAGDQLVMGDAPWQVIETPGHAASEVCFFEPTSQTLISGDIVVGNGGASVTAYPHPAGRPARWIVDILDSLDHLATLGPRRILPGHGPEIARDGAREIVERRARVQRRLNEVADLVRGHPRTAWDLSLAIYPAPVAGTTVALFQTIGYLEALEGEGRVRSMVRDGKREYRG